MLTTTTAIVNNSSIGHHQHKFPFAKRNKLPTSGSFSVDTVDMSTSITTTMLTPPSYLSTMTTCSKTSTINTAVHQQQQQQQPNLHHQHHHQQQQQQPQQQEKQQQHYMTQKQASNYRCNGIDIAEQEPSACSSAATVSLTPPPLEGPISSSCIATKGNSTPLFTQKMTRTIPSDKINLRLILVSGKTKEFVFNATDSAGDIAQTVFDNWPVDWSQEAVSKSEILRLIYQGRFLHCNVTLGALGLPLGKTTVMHLVPRDNLPEPNSQDQRLKSKSGSGRCCSTTCCIL